MESFLTFIVASLICTAAPGPDNLAILSLGLTHGRRAGMGFALGCALGCLTHTVWAALGVAALVATSDIAFGILKYAGAAYLVYLGLNALRSRGAKIDATQPEASSRFLLRGFIANAINQRSPSSSSLSCRSSSIRTAASACKCCGSASALPC